MFGGLTLSITLHLDLATNLSHEQQIPVHIGLLLEEKTLHHANLMNELSVVVRSTDLANRSLDCTDESQQQISQHNDVEDKSDEEDEPLRVIKANDVVTVQSSNSTNEDLSPDVDVLAEPLVFPRLEVCDFHFLVKGWFNSFFRVFIVCGRDVKHLSNGLEAIRECEHTEHHNDHVGAHLLETFLDHSDRHAEGLDTPEHHTKANPEAKGRPSNQLPVPEPVWLIQVGVVEVSNGLAHKNKNW